jgi:hypothetical protein
MIRSRLKAGIQSRVTRDVCGRRSAPWLIQRGIGKPLSESMVDEKLLRAEHAVWGRDDDLRGPRGQWRQFVAGGSPCAAEPSPADLFATQPMNI